MNLFIHLSTHVVLALLAGFIVWLIYRKPLWSFLAGFLSGVLVDLDHLIDYFLAFGWSFNLVYFRRGYEFMKNNKNYTIFHGWEYVIILLVIWMLVKNKTAKAVALALALGLFFHLGTDVVIDKLPIKSYSIIYKIKSNFDVEKMVSPEHWEKHQQDRKKFGFE
jgi:hypothetical protein